LKVKARTDEVLVALHQSIVTRRPHRSTALPTTLARVLLNQETFRHNCAS